MVKEAFVEKATAHKIVYRLNDKTEGYQQVLFEGMLIITKSV